MALDKFQPYLFVSAGEQSNKYLTPVISPEGIASFQAQRVQDLSGLKVRIDPVQEGTGDPSPTNIRPISGRTGMTVTAAGKNLAIPGYNTETVIKGVTITPTEKGIRARGTATARRAIDLFTVAEGYRHIPLAEGTRITGSVYKDGDISACESPFIGYYANGAYASNIGYLTANNNYTLSWTVTARYADAYDSYFRAYIYFPNEATVDFEIGLQIEIGSSATAYEPYKGATYPISWQTQAGTVYGGTLDVVSGVLTVDWDYIASYDGETLPGEWISDRDVYEEGTTPTAGAEVAYKLAEPVTYQLTTTDIKTLAGFNQIYSDAGPIIDIKF